MATPTSTSRSFALHEQHEAWADAPENQFVVFVWLGSPGRTEGPRYWIARKAEVGRACAERRPKNPEHKERRFFLKAMPVEWENAWQLFDPYTP